MLKSMTAFGRACIATPLGRFVVEIQSVNRKHLEISTFMPKELVRFDPDVKNWIAKQVLRGQIIVKVSAVFDKESPVVVQPNLPLARQYKQAWDKIADDLGIIVEPEAFLKLISKDSGILLFEENIKDEGEYRENLKKAVEGALQDLVAMKVREGVVLQQDINSRLQNLRGWLGAVAVKAPGATQRYRQKLIERLKEVLEGNLEADERILKEIGIYSEKIDITEEITRFESHLGQFSALIGSETESVGKTLDFLIQELNREINTIASKSSDIEVSRLVVEIKSELERIREQIQNVE